MVRGYILASLIYMWLSNFPVFPNGLAVKNPPAMKEMQEIQVWSLGWEDPLEKEMATHYSNLAWEIPWTEEPGGLQSMGSQGVRLNLATKQQ